MLKDCTYISPNIFVPFLSDWDRVRGGLTLNLLKGCCEACCAWFFWVILLCALNLDDALSSSSLGGASVHVTSNQIISDSHLCFAYRESWNSNTAKDGFVELGAGTGLPIFVIFLIVNKSQQVIFICFVNLYIHFAGVSVSIGTRAGCCQILYELHCCRKWLKTNKRATVLSLQWTYTCLFWVSATYTILLL